MNRPMAPQPGRDVRITVDIDLQQTIEHAFTDVRWVDKNGTVVEEHEMHGAAIVLDIPTNQVRAMVSWPTYDLNQRESLYASLAADRINRPLTNRATQMSLPPGSTVKPIVGLGAVTMGAIGINEGIFCTGYLIINGQQLRNMARCWTASRYAKTYGDEYIADHSFDGHPRGTPLMLVDAIQRSCNVFFETLGERMKLDGLHYWFNAFGLGRKTGIGLSESAGQIPSADLGFAPRELKWFSAIGQSGVTATPIQMANVAATVARDGVWMRPRLMVRDADARPAGSDTPDRVNLHLSPEALAAVKEGMYRVVNTRAGSGYAARREDVDIAGKTGTAQAGAVHAAKARRQRRARPRRGRQGCLRRSREIPHQHLARPQPQNALVSRLG